ncbi:MAG TPA: hypothetical protein VHQ64_16625, partial [Pyrinomonadaceae bacterium]|nr:hypothetical protein [Pyrinomonadaceae bacterium]
MTVHTQERQHLITSIAYILLLALPAAFGALPANPQSGSDGITLAEALTKGSWEHLTNVGPPNHRIALESFTLTFCGCGHVRETIADDTGPHETYGSWSLEHTEHGDVLILPAGLRYHGRFSIKYLEKEQAIELSIGAPEQALRLQSAKTKGDPCTPPNLSDRGLMPDTRLAEALIKGSWEYETNAGSPSNPIARERR